MKRTETFLAATLLAFTAVACQQAKVADNRIEEANAAAQATVETLPPDEGAGTAADDGFNLTSSKDGDTNAGMPILPEDAAKATIPAQYHGRWGLAAADCTSTRGDAKGLMTIGDKVVRFYESTATLKEQRPAIATSFSGLFGFTGEGQSWDKVMTFTRNGSMLRRAQDGGTFNYRRCA